MKRALCSSLALRACVIKLLLHVATSLDSYAIGEVAKFGRPAAYLGSLAAEAVHAVNFNDEVTKRLLSTQARAIEVLSTHVERERIAGRQLPLDEAELSILRSLEDTQRALATAQSRPLPSPFDGATQFVRTASLSMMPLAAMGLVALILLETPQRRT